MKRFANHSIAVALCVAATACGSSTGQDTASMVDERGFGELRLMVTVDWEGRELADSNLDAMAAMRERFPEVPLVHFLNAAYFTKPGADAEDVRLRIDRVLRDHDELGLHIHGWMRLFEASGVEFRSSPTFWGGSVPGYQCSVDCGHDVPISAYDPSELGQVIRFSLDTLEGAGFGRAASFRAGGWMASQPVREAVALEGLLVDSSAVPAAFLQEGIGDLPLYRWVEALWDGTSSASQPYELDGLTEVPDNGALADYVTADEMFAVYVDAKRRLAEDPAEDVVVNIGFHQETAERFLSRVEEALERILDDAEQSDLPMQLSTLVVQD